jgi:hypothetical protein
MAVLSGHVGAVISKDYEKEMPQLSRAYVRSLAASTQTSSRLPNVYGHRVCKPGLCLQVRQTWIAPSSGPDCMFRN